MEKPCDWCTRDTQEICPECRGTGFIEVEEGKPELMESTS